MAEDESPNDEAEAEQDGEEKSFRERVEEIREKRAEEAEEGEGPPEGGMEEMMGGGPPGGMGGGGGNPFAQMMSGMMGGGPGGAGPGGPGGRGGRGGAEESPGNEELTREVRQLRDEVRDATRQLQRIADALEDD